MFEEFDKVIYKPTGEPCFIVAVDDGDDGVVYGLESEDQTKANWFRWCDEDEIEPFE